MPIGSNYGLLSPFGSLGGSGWQLNAPAVAPVGSVSAPSYSFTGSTSTGWYSPAANQLQAASNGQSGPLLYHDGSRFRTQFATAGMWLLWTNGTNGVVLSSPTFNATNDGVLLLQGFGTANAGLDIAAQGRIKYAGTTGNLRALTSAETQNCSISAKVHVDTSGSITTAQTTCGFHYSSSAAARAVTLPSAANSYLGYTATFIQEGGNAITVTGGASVTVWVNTASKTAGSFVSGADGSVITLVCTVATGSVATYVATSVVGTWT